MLIREVQVDTGTRYLIRVKTDFGEGTWYIKTVSTSTMILNIIIWMRA